MGFLDRVFKRGMFFDNRKARRAESPALVAFYWDGATPNAHQIRNISSHGFYLLTDEKMRPGTVITMTLQKTANRNGDSAAKPHLNVMSMVIRQGEDGVGFAFLPQEPKDSDQEQNPDKPAGRKAISRFLEQIDTGGGHMNLKLKADTPKPPPSLENALPATPGASSPRRRFYDESGQVLMVSLLSMSCLLGFVALATDVGIMMRAKRQAQTAADAAAIAGAMELNADPANVTSAALAAAGQNGFAVTSNGVKASNGVTVSVDQPSTGRVQVIVSVQQSTIFMGLFGFSSMTPAARAVATNGGGSSFGCVYVLAPTGTGMNLQGNFDLTAPNCGLIIDSTDPSAALNFTGKAGNITAGSVGVVGGVSGSSSGTQPVKIVAASDPLNYLIAQMPDPTKSPLAANCKAPAGGTLTGAVAAPTGGVACYSGDVTISNATLSGGTFVFTGNVTLDGSVITTNATLDLNSGSLQENTGTTLDLNPPGAGANFEGISIMAPPTNPGPLAFAKGDATGTINGDIYAPGATMTLQDHGGSGKKGGLILNTDLIVKVLNDTAADITINSYSQSNPGLSLLTRVSLIE
jgi:Flp pilus assembly protein TadG